jgi:hypothetical protein
MAGFCKHGDSDSGATEFIFISSIFLAIFVTLSLSMKQEIS